MSKLVAGTYKAIVIGVEYATTKSGKDQLVLEFGVNAGPDKGATIKKFCMLTDAAVEYTVRDLRTCSWQGTDLGNIDADSLPTEVDIVLENEEYNGKWNVRVKYVNGPDGPKKRPPLSRERRAELSERYKHIATSPELAPTVKQPAAKVNHADAFAGAVEPYAGDADDPIPF